MGAHSHQATPSPACPWSGPGPLLWGVLPGERGSLDTGPRDCDCLVWPGPGHENSGQLQEGSAVQPRASTEEGLQASAGCIVSFKMGKGLHPEPEDFIVPTLLRGQPQSPQKLTHHRVQRSPTVGPREGLCEGLTRQDAQPCSAVQPLPSPVHSSGTEAITATSPTPGVAGAMAPDRGRVRLLEEPFLPQNQRLGPAKITMG